VANNLVQALKDLNDSWTLKKLIANKKQLAFPVLFGTVVSFFHGSIQGIS
jgi:hypothetical protein